MVPNPIPLRADPTAIYDRVNQALIRSVIASSRYALDPSAKPADYARRRWGSETANSVDWMTRAASSPAMMSTPGWAQELSHVILRFLESLVPASAGADLLGRGWTLTFDRAGTI